MSTIKSQNLKTLDGAYEVPTETVCRGTAKAWVNFNGTGTVAIRKAFNVSSITDIGTGEYYVNFTVPMADTFYSSVAMGGPGNWGALIHTGLDDNSYRTTSSLRLMSTTNSTSARVDCEICVAVFD